MNKRVARILPFLTWWPMRGEIARTDLIVAVKGWHVFVPTRIRHFTAICELGCKRGTVLVRRIVRCCAGV